jgi:hypothetical protein
MFDYVRCDALLPDDFVGEGHEFQTKDLWRAMFQFVITANGRLIYRKQTHESLPDREIRPGMFLPQYKLVHEEPVDMEYHGDIELCGRTKDNRVLNYVARFTHGTLEWVRPYEELSEIHKSWFYGKD